VESCKLRYFNSFDFLTKVSLRYSSCSCTRTVPAASRLKRQILFTMRSRIISAHRERHTVSPPGPSDVKELGEIHELEHEVKRMGVFSRVYNPPESIGYKRSSRVQCEHGPFLAEFWVHKCQFVQLSARVHGHEHGNSKVNDRNSGEQFFQLRCLRPRFTANLAGRPGRLIPGCIWASFQRNFFSRH